MLHFRVFAITHPPRTPDFFAGLTPIPGTLVVLPPTTMSEASVAKLFPYLITSLRPYFLFSNSFACHTSEKSPSKSNHCLSSKFAINNSLSCHTSETPGGAFCQIRSRTNRLRSFFLLPSRDEKPVTASSLKSVLTNCDARNSFRIRSYENCRVSSAFFSLSALFLPRAFHNSFPFNGICTPSINSRVSEVPFRLRELCVLCDLCVNSDSFFGLSTVNFRHPHPPKQHRPSGAPRNALHWKVTRPAAAPIVRPPQKLMPDLLPSLVIVGRPNVGKSTLFNRLTGTRRSIVTNEPGITRDRIYGKAEWRGRALESFDTAGIVPDDKALIPH